MPPTVDEKAAMPLLAIENLSVDFATTHGRFRAVDRVSLALEASEVLAIVGESGSGKSVSMLAVMGLLPWTAKVTADRLEFDGIDLLAITARQRRRIIGNHMAMIFQEPMSSLNPCYTVGFQLTEALKVHLDMGKAERRARAIELLRQVGIGDAERRLGAFPHQLSGGMSQRVMIAMAISCNPRLLIADEPTTALDVTIQAQILDLLRELKASTLSAIILITHDLGVVAEICDEVAVMYAGEIVERAPVEAVFWRPAHPYTVGLLGSIPRLDHQAERLATIEGRVPDMTAPPTGCRFAPRCPFAEAACVAAAPPIVAVADNHWTRCARAPIERLVS